MKGTEHVILTVLTFLPIVLPFFFITYETQFLAVFFLFSIGIGAIIPDVDSEEKTMLFYQFEAFENFIKLIVMNMVIFIFKNIVSKKYKLTYEVKDEHRGIMHSLAGITIVSFILFISIGVLSIFIKFNIILILAVSLGFFIGQFMHLVQDSCTVSGINWYFPFKEKIVKGKIYTYQKDRNKIDLRTELFEHVLTGIAMLSLFLQLLIFRKNPIILFVLMSILLTVIWVLFLLISKSDSKIWYRETNKREKYLFDKFSPYSKKSFYKKK